MNGEGFAPAMAAVEAALTAGTPVIAAIDGRCGSGKTALAAAMEARFSCRVFHMDDFYMPFDRRDPDWENIPAGNMDLDRVRREVLLPAREGQPVDYRPWRSKTSVTVPPRPLTVIEGSYSHHPRLADLYDVKIFLTCGSDVQRRRLMRREGTRFQAFQDIWIPMEEMYFRSCQTGADSIIINTSRLFP